MFADEEMTVAIMLQVAAAFRQRTWRETHSVKVRSSAWWMQGIYTRTGQQREMRGGWRRQTCPMTASSSGREKKHKKLGEIQCVECNCTGIQSAKCLAIGTSIWRGHTKQTSLMRYSSQPKAEVFKNGIPGSKSEITSFLMLKHEHSQRNVENKKQLCMWTIIVKKKRKQEDNFVYNYLKILVLKS